MKYYNITVNGVAYSVSVEETAAGAAPVAAAAPAAPSTADELLKFKQLLEIWALLRKQSTTPRKPSCWACDTGKEV